MEDIRTYYFGKNEKHLKAIFAHGGSYLSADRIKHYEDIYGPLYSVEYKGKTVLA